jgi:hypothetical protein
LLGEVVCETEPAKAKRLHEALRKQRESESQVSEALLLTHTALLQLPAKRMTPLSESQESLPLRPKLANCPFSGDSM